MTFCNNAVTDNLLRISNHPVHIHNEGGQLSPSAFIPFCEFGGNMSTMGVKIDQFDIPVCNSFQAKILNDQLCYEVDLEMLRNSNNIKNDIKLGLALLMDYNEDKQFVSDMKVDCEDNESFGSKIDGFNEDENAFIYLNTIGIRLTPTKIKT